MFITQILYDFISLSTMGFDDLIDIQGGMGFVARSSHRMPSEKMSYLRQVGQRRVDIGNYNVVVFD